MEEYNLIENEPAAFKKSTDSLATWKATFLPLYKERTTEDQAISREALGGLRALGYIE